MSATSASLTVAVESVVATVAVVATGATVVAGAVVAGAVVLGTASLEVTAGWVATEVVAAGTLGGVVGLLLAADDPHAASPTVMLTAIAASITVVGPSR